MSRERFRARPKKVQKLGRDGLVEQDRATGEEQRVSQRTADVSFGRERPSERDAAQQGKERSKKARLRAQIAEYHKYYDVIHYGDLYRLIDPAQNAFRAAWMFVSEDKSEALVTSVVMRRPPEYALYLRLKGLDPEKLYREEASGEVYSGASLMYAGLNLFGTDLDDGTSFKLYFKEVK